MRPLPLSRAAVLATLLPDPDDESCPDDFRLKAASLLGVETSKLREALIHFIAEFSSWKHSTDPAFLQKARLLVDAAYPNETPTVLDPFAGLGTIPLEVLRVGANAVSGDLNPVAYIIEKVLLEYLPRYKARLIEAVDKWGYWLLEQLKTRVGHYYPSEPDGATVWWYELARVIRCENPDCGANIPMLRKLNLSGNQRPIIAVRYWGNPTTKQVEWSLFTARSRKDLQPQIGRRFQVTCPVCSFTTNASQVRTQMLAKNGGTNDAVVIAKAVVNSAGQKQFRVATEQDQVLFRLAFEELQGLLNQPRRPISPIPDEPIPLVSGSGLSGLRWGFRTWTDLHTPRQLLVLLNLTELLHTCHLRLVKETPDPDFAAAVLTTLSTVVSAFAAFQTSLSMANTNPRSLFDVGVGIGMRAMMCEPNPFIAGRAGGFELNLQRMIAALKRQSGALAQPASVYLGSATSLPLPNNSITCVVTDPPYYDTIPFGVLADFHYVWLKRMLRDVCPDAFNGTLGPKADECVAGFAGDTTNERKDPAFYRDTITKTLKECQRVMGPNGLAVIYFAHKGTEGWAAFLEGILNAGWQVTGGWPVQAERLIRVMYRTGGLLHAVQLIVCRPRLANTGPVRWERVKAELETELSSWIELIQSEGISGTDLVYSALIPAMQIYSRYNTILDSNHLPLALADRKGARGRITQRGFISRVFDLVAELAYERLKESEPDARLTAWWLLESRRRGQHKLPYEVALNAIRQQNIPLDGLLDRVLKVKNGQVELLRLGEREAFLIQQAHEWSKMTTLDRFQYSLLVVSQNDWGKIKELIRERLQRDHSVWQLAEALCSLYPESWRERSLTEILLTCYLIYGPAKNQPPPMPTLAGRKTART